MPIDDGNFKVLREDLAAFRNEMNTRLDRLVSQDAFEGERRRVDERMAQLGKELVDEVSARKLAVAAEEKSRTLVVQELERRNARTGSWIRWTIGVLLGGGGVVATVLAIYQLLHP